MSEETNDRLKWITHKGKQIIISDYQNLEGDAFLNQIKQNGIDLDEISRREGKMLIITDITGATVSKEILQALKERTKDAQRYTKAQAVIGITGVRKFLFNVVQSLTSASFEPFNTYEEAKDWLVEQPDK